ncbi:hypothetical protein [Haloarcula sp. CGMCC 1.6347]|uniref:hypothetical protein n=1 Tax=Haloarcula sp. CGMCC 1.6347 TaxID=3111455 RepID=UPI00300F6945
MPQTSIGGQLVLFLFLLIPGYAGLRSYLWANIALDDTTRLTKLVLLALGGFASLVIVSIARQFWLEFAFIPDSMAISGGLSINTISDLSVLQAANLITAQSVAGLILGLLIGSLKYILVDVDNPRRRDLNRPWDEIFSHVSRGDEITVVTRYGEKIMGNLEQMGDSSEDYDLVLSSPKKSYINENNQTESQDHVPLGQLSYHHSQDISRIEAYEEKADIKRGWVNRQYIALLQKGVNIKKRSSKGASRIYYQLNSHLERTYESYRIPIFVQSDRDEKELDLQSEYAVSTSNQADDETPQSESEN